MYNDIDHVVYKKVEVFMTYDVNKMLEYALQEVSRLENEEIFLIKDLFKGYEWNRIPRNERLLLGTLFLNRIRSDDINVNPIEKTTSGLQRYKKLTSKG